MVRTLLWHFKELSEIENVFFSMAYGVKYELIFSDIQKRKIKLEILEKNYTGSASAIVGTGDPVQIEWDADDDIYSPIIGSRCKLSFFVTDSAVYDEFYKADERQYKVKVLQYSSFDSGISNNTSVWNLIDVTWDSSVLGEGVYFQPIWEGFLVVDRYQEAVVTSPYQIQLEAIDGLGTLDGFDSPFDTNTDNSQNLFYYLKEILKITGHTFDIYIANSIRKATSPDSQETIFHDIEINEYGLLTQKMTLRNAKDVLEQILKITNSRIFQSFGRWYVISNSNLIDSNIDTTGVIDTVAGSGDDTTDDPEEDVATATYTAPSITIVGATSASTAGAFSFTLSNVGTPIVSYLWTLPDSSTYTSSYVSFQALSSYDGGTLSVTVTDADGNTDSDSVTLTVTTYTPPPAEPETPQVQHTLKFVVSSTLSNAYASPEIATLNFNEDQVGDAFSFNIKVFSLTGEFTSATQVTTATVSGGYTLVKTLVGDYINLAISGNYPSSGATETVIIVGAADVQQFTTTYTRTGTVQNSSFSLNPTNLSKSGGTDKPYEMTITYTANTDYEWRGPQDLTVLQSSRVPSNLDNTVTVTKTSDTTLVVKITGAQGIQDQSATFNITGTPVYGADATTVTIDPSGLNEVTSAGGYVNVSISGADGKYSIAVAYLGASTDWITLDKNLGNPTTTDLVVNFSPNNTSSSRRAAVQFKAYASNTVLATLTLNQASNIQGG